MAPTRFERSARFWLRSYPRRWRNRHGEELLAALAEFHVPPDDVARASGLPLAEIVRLLREGWGLRWREHPPLGRWIAYRLLDLRLPERYWWWVADDIQGPLFVVRYRALTILPMLVLLTWQHRALGTQVPSWFLGVVVAAFVAVVYLVRKILVRSAWTRHVAEGNVPPSMRGLPA